MSGSMDSSHKKRLRNAPVVWGSSALAAAVLVLGINGTLSTWTQAIIDNGNNSAASASAVALTETVKSQANQGGAGGTQTVGTVCDTRTQPSNELTDAAACDTINKYGGIGDVSASTDTGFATDAEGVPLGPGDSQTVVVTMKNVGNTSAPLKLSPGACSSHVYPGATGVDTTTYPLCNKMQLSVSCTSPATYTGYSGTVAALASDQAIGALAAGESTDCTFTVSIPSSTGAGYASQYVTQDLTWTLGS